MAQKYVVFDEGKNMYRILKYPCGYDNNIGKWYTYAPSGNIIRTAHVDDGTYKGYWVWIITTDDALDKRTFDWIDEPDIEGACVQLGVLESQYVALPGFIDYSGVEVREGKIYLHYLKGCEQQHVAYKAFIVGYKTGQEIPYHPNGLAYIGVAPLFIKNEIAIYFFEAAYVRQTS
jgi:hypothetical protein